MCCCALLPNFYLLLQKNCADIFCVVLKSHSLVICYHCGVQQYLGHTKVLPQVVCQCLWIKRANYVARAVVMLKSLRSVALLGTFCFAEILINDH
jgi:hypothetical protein